MTTGLDVFDTTIQKTNLWLKEIMEELGWDDRRRALMAMRAVLHALRDRLDPKEAADLGAQLPVLVRGFYYEAWDPTDKPEKIRHKRDFLYKVDEGLINEPELDSEKITRAIFKVLKKRVAEGEVRDIKATLPEEIAAMWE